MNEVEKKKRVLVVDDHPKVLTFIEIDFKLRGYEVICTSSGKEALELVSSAKPDIMLLDMVMPGLDGFEVLRKLQAVSELPVIAFSAHSSAVKEALRLGANDFMAKPFRPDELANRINALLNHQAGR